MTNHKDIATKYGTSKKTLASYITGLVLSLIFTVCAFLVVSQHPFTNTITYIAIAALAVAQFIAQVICFLRLNSTPEGRWNLFPFLFFILIVLVLVAGSIWIMVNLNNNMV